MQIHMISSINVRTKSRIRLDVFDNTMRYVQYHLTDIPINEEDPTKKRHLVATCGTD